MLGQMHLKLIRCVLVSPLESGGHLITLGQAVALQARLARGSVPNLAPLDISGKSMLKERGI